MLHSEAIFQTINMSIRIVITDSELTINESLDENENIFEYINRALIHYENKDAVSIYLIIKTDKQLIEIRMK